MTHALRMMREEILTRADGIDGLGGIHHSVRMLSPSQQSKTSQTDKCQHPHLTPAETWKSLFKPRPDTLYPEEAAELQAVKDAHSLFTPSLKPAHEEMLQMLRENEPDTITIVAIGPLTNLAIAAATDPEAFLRVREVVVMGGAVDAPGNVSSALFLLFSYFAPRLFLLLSLSLF